MCCNHSIWLARKMCQFGPETCLIGELAQPPHGCHMAVTWPHMGVTVTIVVSLPLSVTVAVWELVVHRPPLRYIRLGVFTSTPQLQSLRLSSDYTCLTDFLLPLCSSLSLTSCSLSFCSCSLSLISSSLSLCFCSLLLLCCFCLCCWGGVYCCCTFAHCCEAFVYCLTSLTHCFYFLTHCLSSLAHCCWCCWDTFGSLVQVQSCPDSRLKLFWTTLPLLSYSSLYF